MSDLMTQVQQIMDEENVIAARLAAAMRAKQAAQPGADVSPTGNGGTSTAIESDEYLQAQGYLAHDADGARIRGVEVVA